MKKYCIIYTDENNNPKTTEVISDSKVKDLKKLPGFIAIKNAVNIKHPSPLVLRKVIDILNINPIDFYGECEQIAKELKNAE